MPRNAYTHPSYFFWSGRSKRKSEVSNWIKIFGKILAKATETHPKLFLEADSSSRPAHLHMLRDTFAVEYLLAGMPLEEVSRLLGHSSVLITQKHYAPWVLERQQRLATSVRTAWSTMGSKHHRPGNQYSGWALGQSREARRPFLVQSPFPGYQFRHSWAEYVSPPISWSQPNRTYRHQRVG